MIWRPLFRGGYREGEEEREIEKNRLWLEVFVSRG
jgi:hypothetical protein